MTHVRPDILQLSFHHKAGISTIYSASLLAQPLADLWDSRHIQTINGNLPGGKGHPLIAKSDTLLDAAFAE